MSDRLVVFGIELHVCPVASFWGWCIPDVVKTKRSDAMYPISGYWAINGGIGINSHRGATESGLGPGTAER